MKTAIVTGAGRGIGFSIAEELLKNGWKTLLCARHENDNIKALSKIYGSNIIFISADISSEEDRQNIFKVAEEKLGKIDLLVNDAGVAPKQRKDMLEISEEDFDYVIDINLKGTYFMTQKAARLMIENRKGYIINIGSISANTVSLNRAEYCISKAGIRMITELFAARLAKYNIGVFEIAPGVINTDMIKTVKTKYDNLAEQGIIPAKRLGEGKDAAKIVLSVASGAFDYCTGNVFHCDGGLHIPNL